MPERRRSRAATAGAADPLAAYNAKRDFTRTAEPAGTLAPGHGNAFVVQKHDARRLHWDLRLEVDGVFRSWAVTRGPSLDPAEKRLSVQVEDHPLAYGTFEGTIPAGDYGGGTVMLWDRGTWAPIAGKSAADLQDGHLHFLLAGERMRGEWLLVRLKRRGKEKRDNWLLRKVADADAGGTDALVEDALTSVATGRTMAEIAEGRPGKKAVPAKPTAAKAGKPTRRRGKTSALPAFRPPQLCKLVDRVPAGDHWLHEIKYDGYRVQIAVAGGRAAIHTRTGLDWTDKFPAVAAAAARLPGTALIDGEVVAFRDDRPDFSALKDAIAAGGDGIVAMAFDLLEQDGEDLAPLGTLARKDRLRALLADADDALRFSDHLVGSGEALFDQMCGEGLEGVVSKRVDAPYRGGRDHGWCKAKCVQRGRFAVVGWLASDKGRALRSLLLARTEGGLAYAGKVGTGFDGDTLAALRGRLERLARATPPTPVPRAMARGAHWVAPALEVEVAYAEQTPDGLLRHASYLGLAEAKPTGPARPPEAPSAKPAGIVISHPDRLLFEGSDVTKGRLAAYYAAVAPLMLPWAADRPVSLVRCPQGRERRCFFQKHDTGGFGPAVHRLRLPEPDGEPAEWLYVQDAAGLVSCVQMGAIEFHGWGSSVPAPERPDRLVFDLDPDEALPFGDVVHAAEAVRDRLGELGLASFALLSGGKGVHVVVPLTPQAGWDAVRSFAERFARALAQAEPGRFVAVATKAKRTGRIFVDWLRNGRGSTAVLPYSARARPGAPVAAPVSWTELRTLDDAARWTVDDAAELVRRARQPGLEGWGEHDQILPDI